MKTELQRLRKDAGFKSARAFAEHMGLSVNTYTAFEQGRHKLSLEQAWRFADALGEAMGRYVTLDELAGRDLPRMLAELPRGEARATATPDALSEDERELLEAYRVVGQQAQRRISRSAQGELDDLEESAKNDEGSDAPAPGRGVGVA